MTNTQPATLIHADDYGITATQAHRILSLSSTCGGNGALNSLSIFANSPAFPDAASLVKPHWKHGNIQVRLHLNLVEGAPVSRPAEVPLLVDERGMFANNFLGLLALSIGARRKAFFEQLVFECRSQIRQFLSQFPSQKKHMQIDSHQHVHAIPLVYKALATALQEEGCEISLLREPLDPLRLYHAVRCEGGQRTQNPTSHSPEKLPQPSLANKAKVLLIDALWKKCPKNDMPWAQGALLPAPLFCGVGLSGMMGEFNEPLLSSFQREAKQQNRDLEILFHPVSVPLEECLDPANKPFAEACASASRQLEAERIVAISEWIRA